MFNPGIYANSRTDGFGALEVTDRALAPEKEQRFVPLRQSTLTGTVAGPLAALTLCQVFAFSRREYDGIIEAAYRFPLPGDAAVRGVRVQFGDVEIHAELQPRAQAEAAYVDAKEAGHQAALVTREAPDVFTLHVTGIKPDEAVEITTEYVQLARAEGPGWLLRIPLTTAPRYVRADDLHTAHAQGQPLALLRDPGHRFLLDVVFYGTGSVTSPTHELALMANDGTLQVSLVAGEVIPDRDCVLIWTPAQSDDAPTLSVFTQDDAEHTYFLALVAPPAAARVAHARESIVLLDHSGSMTGAKWQAADWAVEQLFLDLTARDRFDLCLFHTSTAWFAKTPQPATRPRVDEAVAWLKSRSDSGGTNLGVALEEALLLPRPRAETPDGADAPARHVLIVTDAAVTDGGRILRLADDEAQRADRRRISVLCIDEAPNAFLANELAVRGGGAAVFLTSSPEAEDMATALDNVLAAWSAPAMTNLRVTVPGRAVEDAAGSAAADGTVQTGLDLGELPSGQARWVAGRVPRQDDAPLTVRLEQGTEARAEITVSTTEGQSIDAIKPLFGVRRVNALEFLTTARYDDAALRAQLRRLGYDPDAVFQGHVSGVYAETQATQTEAALRELLVAESLRYGLLSSVTAFVGVRAEAGHEVARQVVVANALPHGWSPAFLGASNVRAMRMKEGATYSVHFMTSAAAKATPKATGVPAMPAMHGQGPMGQGPLDRGAKPQWRTVFQGRLSTGKEQLLYDSAADGATNAHEELISGLRLTTAAEEADVDVRGVVVQVFVGDLALPRARVRLADLLRTPERPLNLARQPGAVVRLVLTDPEHRLEHVALEVRVELRVQTI